MKTYISSKVSRISNGNRLLMMPTCLRTTQRMESVHNQPYLPQLALLINADGVDPRNKSRREEFNGFCGVRETVGTDQSALWIKDLDG